MNKPVAYAAERLALRLLLCAVIALFLAYMVPLLWSTLSPFIIALPVAAGLQPLIRFFEKKLHLGHGFAVVFWVLLVSVAALFVVYWFVSFAVGQIISAANNAPTLVNGTINVLREASDRVLNAAESIDRETMLRIVDVHFPGIHKRLVAEALTVFFEIREVPGLKKKPSTSELLDWLKLLLVEDIPPEALRTADARKLIPPLHGALLKNEQDVHLFERLAFLSRREQR